MAPNVPVLIRGACSGWRALREWVAPDGGVNTRRLQQLAGGCSVAVTDTARCGRGGVGPHAWQQLVTHARPLSCAAPANSRRPQAPQRRRAVRRHDCDAVL